MGAWHPPLPTPARLRIPQVVPNFRIRTIPVLGTTPAVFGMAAAGYVLCCLAGAPFASEPIAIYQVRALPSVDFTGDWWKPYPSNA
jgi:hypothetical protein